MIVQTETLSLIFGNKLYCLACELNVGVHNYNGCIVDGVRFPHTSRIVGYMSLDSGYGNHLWFFLACKWPTLNEPYQIWINETLPWKRWTQFWKLKQNKAKLISSVCLSLHATLSHVLKEASLMSRNCSSSKHMVLMCKSASSRRAWPSITQCLTTFLLSPSYF